MKVSVIGAGSWGTTVAALIARRERVTLWSRRPELAASINAENQNADYLPGVALPTDLYATSDLGEATSSSDVVLLAVPSHWLRSVVSSASGIPASIPVVSLTKGIEQSTLMRMTEVVNDVLPDHDPRLVGVLTGPNLATEIIAGQPAAAVIAMQDEPSARLLQGLLMGPTFRVYTNPDVIGAEAAGAAKNVMAIGAGMARGLGFGDNSLATLITRALAEITRLGTAMGGSPHTFAGLAGMGDLIATCISSLSRNNRVGYGLGQGRSLEEITSEMKMVAEGVKSTPGVLALAQRHEVEMPIAEQVHEVLYGGTAPPDAVEALMTREPRAEG